MSDGLRFGFGCVGLVPPEKAGHAAQDRDQAQDAVAALIPPGAAPEPGRLIEPAIAKIGLLQPIERKVVDLGGQGALGVGKVWVQTLAGRDYPAAGPCLGSASP
jgi:hypothetical protein